MEPTMLLFLEVFGMIAIAVYVTVARARDKPVCEGRELQHLLGELPLVNTTILCPERRLRADLVIGVDRSGPRARLGVVSCDLLGEGKTCDLACVGGIAQAQGS